MQISFEYINDDDGKIIDILITFSEGMAENEKVAMLWDIFASGAPIFPLAAQSIKQHHPTLFKMWRRKFQQENAAVAARGVFSRE
jgi:hypothetical protein